MSGYIEIDIETDANTLAAGAFDYLAANIPGWVPQEGHIESWLIEALARIVAEARVVASKVPTAVFRYFGESILALPPVDAAEAEATSTWTMVDTQGYTIPTGTLVAWRTAGDTLVPFEVVDAVTVPPGSSVTAADAVTLRALDAGTAPNSLAGGSIELVDSLAYVQGIEAASPSGGVDAESDADYLDRLSSELQLLTPRPILPADFAALARRIPGVHRALGVNMYDPNTETYDNERTITVAVVAEDGSDLPDAVKDDTQVYLDSLREVNFVVHVIGPSYRPLTVQFEAVAFSGADPTMVQTAAAAAVRGFLDPGTWGGGDQSPPEWENNRTVRYLELAAVLNAVDGLDYLTTLTLNGNTSDVVLAGVAPLPATTTDADPTIITGTVSSP